MIHIRETNLLQKHILRLMSYLLNTWFLHNVSIEILDQHKISVRMRCHLAYFWKLLCQHFWASIMEFWPQTKKGMQLFLNPYIKVFQDQQSKRVYIDGHTRPNWGPRLNEVMTDNQWSNYVVASKLQLRG